MRIIILKAGRYNDVFHRAHQVEAGKAFETGADYGQSLIDAGLARDANLPEIFEPIPATESDDAAGAPAIVSAATPPLDGYPTDPAAHTDPIDPIDPDLAPASAESSAPPDVIEPAPIDPVSGLSSQLPGLAVGIVETLVDAGFLTADDIAAAKDVTLLAVPGVTKTVLKQIRKALA